MADKKKSKRYIKEALDNFDKVKNMQAVVDPVTANAIEFSKKKDKIAKQAFKGQGKEFDGAPKQPHPKKAEVPKATLDESLFESSYDEDRVVQIALDVAETEDCKFDVEAAIDEIVEELGYVVAGIMNDTGWSMEEYKPYLNSIQYEKFDHVSYYSVDIMVGVDQDDFPLDTLVQKLNSSSNDIEVVGSDFTDASWSYAEYGLKEGLNTQSSLKESTTLNEDSYGWSVDPLHIQDAYEEACEYFGEDDLNAQIVRCMSQDELKDCLDFIFRMNDFTESSYLEESCDKCNKEEECQKDNLEPKKDEDEQVLNEAPVYELSPNNDSRKSFYGKAKVNDDDKDNPVLYSYDTPVCQIKDGNVYLMNKWNVSATTLRHVKEFLKQHGFKADSRKQMEHDYGKNKSDIEVISPEKRDEWQDKVN